ncbi:MAG: hypothetical protein JST90_14930 [Bacteroidetes bacterium]|nr:hypothetical protein [Bacteroidota bacterium]
MVLFVLAIIVIIIIAASNQKKPQTVTKTLAKPKPTPEPNIRVTITKKDESIIDVSGQSQKLDTSSYQSNSTNSNTQYYQPQYQGYNQNDYRLGNVYKSKLLLSAQEVSWLNKFWNPNNVFLSIEGCCIETIKLYLATLKELNKHLKKSESTIAKEVETLLSLIKGTYTGSTTYWSYDKENYEAEMFSVIFKRCESQVREAWGHKRKIATDFSNSNSSVLIAFNTKIGNPVDAILKEITGSISNPDLKTEEQLNIQNTSRWKIKFDQLTKSFVDSKKQDFIDGIFELEKRNQKNPNIENIFFESSKFISKFDKKEALKFYIYYIHYDLKSTTFDNKQLTKTIQKSLFKNPEELIGFEKIISDLIKTKNLPLALDSLKQIYEPKRKKINLDVSAIKIVQAQDKNTVDLLSEYLEDEPANQEEIALRIEVEHQPQTHRYFKDFKLNDNQIGLLNLFNENDLNLPFSEMDTFCKSKSIFKNQLIESINEVCYDKLDDVLIEEGDGHYEISEIYFTKILDQ